MRIFLAPMEGVVDHHLREIYSRIGGVDIFVTEFVRVAHTILPNKVFKRLCPELDTPLKEPVRIQLLGSDPTLISQNAIKAAELGAPAIDLNFGCPAKTVNRHRGGACLLNEPELLHSIVKEVRTVVPNSVPVTAKIRLGYESRNNYIENALAIEEAGASELIVHGRSKSDGYRPPAYWDAIGEINAQLNIPVVANGEIWSVSDFAQCKFESGCEDFMLGRGLLAKPDLALAIRAAVNGVDYSPFTWAESTRQLHRLHDTLSLAYQEKYSGNRVKQWLAYLQREYPQAKLFFDKIKRERSKAAIDAAFKEELALHSTPD